MRFIVPLTIGTCQSRLHRGPNPDCESTDELALCEYDCEESHIDCLKSCDGEPHCSSDCTRSFSDCIDNCPCLGIIFFKHFSYAFCTNFKRNIIPIDAIQTVLTVARAPTKVTTVTFVNKKMNSSGSTAVTARLSG